MQARTWAFFCIIFGALFPILPLEGQNLIRNHDFEEFAKFQNFDFGYKDLENNVTTWRNPTEGSPRVYKDIQSAKSGEMFLGVHLYGIKDYREYITTPLKCRLIAGETYVFRMYVKRAENSEFAISSFGALLTEDRPEHESSGIIPDTNQLFVQNFDFYQDQRAWVIVEDSFVAKGGESYLTIGNFLADSQTVTKKMARLAREGRAYYYIDDVFLYPKNGRDPCMAVIDSMDCQGFNIGYENILPDPSFECYKECPSSINVKELYQLEYWIQSSGTPDYYNSCSIIMNVPKNVMGQQDALSGHGYVGMYLFDKGNYREFLTAKFDEPMIKERWYVIKLWAALSENSGLCTDAFEFVIGKNRPDIDSTDLEKIKPQVINSPGNYADSYDWKMICGLYLAEGGEQYITMGNFKNNSNTPLKIVNKEAGEFSYYFIDNFTVESLNDSNMSDCGAGIPLLTQNEEDLVSTRYFEDLSFTQLLNEEPFSFRGFYFEFDKYEILDTNYAFLDSLVDIMLDNEDLRIEVHGHTDDVGSESYNEKLSKNRAISVVDYLISEGIDKRRIKYDYFGAKKPIASNGTPEGRQMNRRCEFILRRK